MPFATHHGHRIHYERTGRGTPVVLAHGMFSSLEGWKRNGWIDRLSTHHLVLAVDSVAHGASDCPEDPACYQRPERVADLLSVLDEEGLDGAHFVGYSMGAWMVSGVATEAPGRLLSLTVGGWDVDEGLRLPKEQFRGTAGGELTFDALAASVAAAAPILQEAMQVADRQALSRCWAPLEAHTSDVDAIKATGAPVLFFCGDGDSYHPNVVRVAGQLGAPMVTVPGANHLTAMMHSELVVPSLLEFFAQASSPPVPAA